jgi:polysaccharide biosynthesis transport protein
MKSNNNTSGNTGNPVNRNGNADRTPIRNIQQSQSSRSPQSIDSLEQFDFQQYGALIKRRWQPALGMFVLTLTLATLAAQNQKPSYVATGKITLKANRLPTLTGLGSNANGEVSNGMGAISNLTPQSSPLRTEAEKLLSKPVVEKAIEALKLKDSSGKLLEAEDLVPRLKVKEVAGADVLSLTYTDGNAEQAAKLVNQLMQEYVKHNVIEHRSEAAAARSFIAQQLPKTEAVVTQADRAVRDFKERTGITDLEYTGKQLVTALSEAETQITRSKTELTEANSRYLSLRDRIGMSSGDAVNASTLSQAAPVQQAQAQWQQLQAQLRLAREQNTEEHPTIVKLKAQEATLERTLQERIGQTIGESSTAPQSLNMGDVKQGMVKEYVASELTRSSVSDRLAVLNAARNDYRLRLDALPRIEQQDRELRRRLAAAQETYQSLLKRLQEVSLAEQQNVGTASIVEMASKPKLPSGSAKQMLMLMGILGGLVAAIATMLLLEMADRSVKNIKDARALYGYAWLGNIPWVGKVRKKGRDWVIPEIPVRDAPRSGVSASYRMLQANLRFLNFDQGLKSVVITSAVPQEGKSTIAANLAATMAQLGRKTLLIDADLHHPSQHHIWNLANASGLSNVIVGQTPLNVAIESPMENLDVIAGGIIPPNPLALLDSKRMSALMQQLENDYDFIIIDAPPLGVEAEALTLGKLADGMLLVARPGILEHQSAKRAKELLQQSHQNVLGLVVNGFLSESQIPNLSYYDHTEHQPLNDRRSKSEKQVASRR